MGFKKNECLWSVSQSERVGVSLLCQEGNRQRESRNVFCRSFLMVSSFGRGGGPAEGAARIIPVWCRAALWSLQAAENTKGACGVDQPQSGTHTLPPAPRRSALNGQSASFKATAQHRMAAEHARVGIKTEDNTEEWAGTGPTKGTGETVSFGHGSGAQKAGHAPITQQTEKPEPCCVQWSWAKTVQEEARNRRKEHFSNISVHLMRRDLYREWAQGGALQLSASYICSKLETQLRMCHYTDGICGKSYVFIEFLTILFIRF